MGDRYWNSIATGKSWNSALDLGLESWANEPPKPSQYELLKNDLVRLLQIDYQAAYERVDQFVRRKARESRHSSVIWAIEECCDNDEVVTLLRRYLKDNF